MNTAAGDFVLPVDKPEGPTSHDVVATARRALGIRRIGHTGTLDPFASGLLVLCVGRATRLSQYLSGLDKSYVAEARLGIETDTLDRDGAVVAESDGWSGLELEVVEAALSSLVGDVEQVPPQFSAKKVAGEAMYRKARRGERVALAPVSVTVHEIELVAVRLPTVRFAVRCTTGTYIRAIARDLGARLGVGAHLTELRRISIGRFRVAAAVSLDELADEQRVARALVAPIDAVGHLARVEVDAETAERLRHGQRVRHLDEPKLGTEPRSERADDALVGRADSALASGSGGTPPFESGPVSREPGVVAVSRAGDLLAIGRLEDRVLRPIKVFST